MVPYTTMGVMDQVIANSYIDAIRSIQVRQTWDFLPPDIILMDLPISGYTLSDSQFMICNYTTIHKNLDTIEPDFYSLCFKKMCLGQVMLWLSAIRSKYENLTTPFGQLNLNWNKLYDDGTRMLEECNAFLTSIPPDKLLEIGL